MLDFKLSKMRKMITTGKNFWGVDVEFLQEDVKETTGVASYDPFFDRVEFHLKWIEKIAKEFPQIIDDEIDFAVLHELGHAKEARIYEEKGLFPYSRNILTDIPPGEISEVFNIVDTFFDGIEDYKVEKKLFENGFLKPLTWFQQALPNMEQVLKKPGCEVLGRDTAFMNLPLSMCSYKFCSLSNAQKRVIKSYYLKFLGKRLWEEMVETIDTLEFGKVNTTVEVASALIHDFFGWTVTLGSIRRKDLELIVKEQHKFAGGFMLPSFWRKNNYSYYSIQVT